MRIGTTPVHTFDLPFEISLIKELKVTYVQAGKTVIEKRLNEGEVEGNSIRFNLTQSETFRFNAGTPVEIQLRALLRNGEALSTDIINISADKCLDREVLK